MKGKINNIASVVGLVGNIGQGNFSAGKAEVIIWLNQVCCKGICKRKYQWEFLHVIPILRSITLADSN